MLDESEVREWLWLHHGCSIAGLYGDDGEMQCSQGHVEDYKRAPLLDILKRQFERAQRGLAVERETHRNAEAELAARAEDAYQKRDAAQARIVALTEALRPFQSGGQWGIWKAFLVHGPATKDEGIAAAKQITGWQVAVDAALNVPPLEEGR